MAIDYEIPGFALGEVSPKLYGRSDQDQYLLACKIAKNVIPDPTGAATRRPGSYYYATGKTSGKRVLLVPFKISPTEGAVLELGDSYLKVHRPGITSVEVTTNYPYAEADLPEVDYVQIANYMYFVHPGYTVRKLTRTVGTPDTWAMAVETFTASGTGMIDFSAADNRPSKVEVYEQRLILAATNANPGRCWASKPGAYTTFTVSSPVVAGDAWVYDFQPAKNPTVLWLGAENAFCFGTEEGAFRVGGPENRLDAVGSTWWPTQQGAHGGAPIKPVIADEALIYAPKGANGLRMFAYLDASAKWESQDITMYAEHLFRDGLYESAGTIAFQRNPHHIIWAVRSDGALLAGAVSKQLGTIGWAEQEFYGEVESVCVVPTDREDRVWVSIKHGNSRHICYLAPFEWDSIEDSVFLDAVVAEDNGALVEIIAVTNDAEAIVTSAGHSLADGTLIKFGDVAGITWLNGQVFKVADAATDTFKIQHISGTTYVDLSGYSAPAAGGFVQPCSNNVSGLTHLEGEDVDIVIDGGHVGDDEVATGAASSLVYGRKLYAGMPIEVELQPMDPRVKRQKYKRLVNLAVFLYNSYGCELGSSPDLSEEVLFSQDLTLDLPPQLSTGMLTVKPKSTYTREGSIYLRLRSPMPLTVLSFVAELEIQT